MKTKIKLKGFTLVELLAIIIILGIISILSYGAIAKMLENSEKQDYERFLKDLYLTTENYIELNRNQFPELNQDGNITISIQTLLDQGYFKKTPVNPKTKKTIEQDTIIVTSKDKILTFEYQQKTT